jgi:glycosyltransferase involved in cell wall biosynthesis
MISEDDIVRSWNGKTEPLLSVICATYNHEEFIRDAVDGFLIQTTDFPFEVIIHDDASTDATVNIVKDYIEKYPRIIRAIFQKENQYSLGHKIIPIVFPHARGRYVALCEGDDYWNDRDKLQKQCDFLNANPAYATCIHNVTVLYDDAGIHSHPHFGPGFRVVRHMYPKPKTLSTLEDLLHGNFIPTPSVMFRSGIINRFPSWFEKCSMGDWPLHVLNAKYGGAIRYMDEMMAVYRVHAHSVWSSSDEVEVLLKSISSAKSIKNELTYEQSMVLEKCIVRWHTKIIRLMLRDKKVRLQKLRQYKHLFEPSFGRAVRLLKVLKLIAESI